MREEDNGPATPGGPAATIKVDPATLRSLAGKLSTISSTVGNAHSARKGLLSPAEGTGAGSAAVAAARAASLAWYGHLAALASRAAVAGLDLEIAANNYTGVDTSAAAHAHRVQHEMDRQS